MHKCYEWLGYALRFFGAGGISLIPLYGTLYLLTEYAHFWYLVSAIIGAVPQHIVNFVLQKRWTFGNKDYSLSSREVKAYTKNAVLVFVTSNVILYVLTDWFALWYLASQAIATIAASVISFVRYRDLFKK